MEIWKDIKGYEGYYQVSNYGNVISLQRSVNAKSNSIATKSSKKRKLCLTKTGYLNVILCKNGIEKNFLVHRLVANHFVHGKTIKKKIVNHIDGKKINNHHLNLEWCTQKQNIIHSHNEGLQNPTKGQTHHFAKLKDEEVNHIRYLFNQGYSRKRIAEMYFVCYSSICRIIKGTQRIPAGLAVDKKLIK